jgi:micrococcal nuclease
MQEWIVPAKITRIIDGDTIAVILDLGWGIYKNDHVRFAGINAPEKSTLEGQEAKAFLETYIGLRLDVMIHSHKLDKYGRCLATVMLGEINLNQVMLDSRHAVPFMVERG